MFAAEFVLCKMREEYCGGDGSRKSPLEEMDWSTFLAAYRGILLFMWLRKCTCVIRGNLLW